MDDVTGRQMTNDKIRICGLHFADSISIRAVTDTTRTQTQSAKTRPSHIFNSKSVFEQATSHIKAALMCYI